MSTSTLVLAAYLGNLNTDHFKASFIGKKEYSIGMVLNKQPNQLYNEIVNYSLYNCATIIVKNVLNAYDISR